MPGQFATTFRKAFELLPVAMIVMHPGITRRYAPIGRAITGSLGEKSSA